MALSDEWRSQTAQRRPRRFKYNLSVFCRRPWRPINIDLSFIRKIEESFKKNKKAGLIKQKDFKELNDNYKKDWYAEANNPEKNTESKRYRWVENKSFVQEITEALDNNHSLGAFRAIVDKIPKQQIRIFLSIIKDTYLTGRIKKSRGAMFISLAKDYARENNINLNFK